MGGLLGVLGKSPKGLTSRITSSGLAVNGGKSGSVQSLTVDFMNNVYERNGTLYPTFVDMLAAWPGSSFARSTTGYNMAATQSFAINVPRVTLVDGLLYEPAMTNLILQPASFDNAAWVKDAGITVTANSDIAPDGSATADRLTFTNYFQKMLYNIAAGMNPALPYFASIFGKQISGPNVDTQVQIGAAATVTPLSLVNWTRASHTEVVGATSANMMVYDAGGLNPVHAYWGAQVEPSQLTSYFPGTRGADAMTLVLDSASTVTYGDNSTAVVGPGAWSPNPTAVPGRRIKSLVKL